MKHRDAAHSCFGRCAEQTKKEGKDTEEHIKRSQRNLYLEKMSTVLFLLAILLTFHGGSCADISLQEMIEEMSRKLDESDKRITDLLRHTMQLELFVAERFRSSGQSGLKKVRLSNEGTKSYHADSFITGKRISSIHDHSNNVRTVGIGEIIAVMNGVEFRTRHNDYRLYMPANTPGYHATQDIPFPDVPPEVLALEPDIPAAVDEMIEWFKAWRDQNYTVRDYRPYFKPLLCYMEGSWIHATDTIEEPFESDRHFVDATSWSDLERKVRFTSYGGRKDNLENFAYLPTTIIDLVNDTHPVFAQWNYRIMCHPLSNDLPLNRLRSVDDLQSRITYKRTLEEQAATRAGRFQINPVDDDEWKDRFSRFGFLDKLMGEIPGKDNYGAYIEDNALGQLARSMDPDHEGDVLNAAYYHRYYKVNERGAMGQQLRHRGFSDSNLWMAMTTQEEVAGMSLERCKGSGKRLTCETDSQKWSYAFPLEIIYLTPLNRWNPYNLEYKGKFNSDEGKTVKEGIRNGGYEVDTAFNGLNSKNYYITPTEMFESDEKNKDEADTTQGEVGVLTPEGHVARVRASGIRAFFPNIPGVGVLRQRYPIMPVHDEGSTTWKELEALEDMIMGTQTFGALFNEPLTPASDTMIAINNLDKPITIRTGQSWSRDILHHTHDLELEADEVEKIKAGGIVTKFSSEIQGHAHEIMVAWHENNAGFYISACDGDMGPWVLAKKCFDKHEAMMTIV
ncbi:uncharacterized protein LOC114537253 isoform X2 [Dendronephthya gigantea]|uniref:uncharacterized protein LOC114537253 isoform X2 n=1 Tax=Dendronephthya gigantea TaxID=151771 RepID=UPI00106C1661|nr:uncharacterized protein LOC114537253 isoform X2 [Dendronephthya gigantea]